MLPFQKKDEASVSVPAETKLRKPDNEEDFDPLHAVAEDLIKAIHTKDIKLTAEVLAAAFAICEMEPHEEGPHNG